LAEGIICRPQICGRNGRRGLRTPQRCIIALIGRPSASAVPLPAHVLDQPNAPILAEHDPGVIPTGADATSGRGRLIDYRLQLGRLPHGRSGGFRSDEDFHDVESDLPAVVAQARPMTKQRASVRPREPSHDGQCILDLF
jgi:hypothetical protein